VTRSKVAPFCSLKNFHHTIGSPAAFLSHEYMARAKNNVPATVPEPRYRPPGVAAGVTATRDRHAHRLTARVLSFTVTFGCFIPLLSVSLGSTPSR
jgi:hypothetical protein